MQLASRYCLIRNCFIHLILNQVYSLQIALRDLYKVHSVVTRVTVNITNAIYVLAAACFLELQDLADYCVRCIASLMSEPEVIETVAAQLDRLDPQNDLPIASYGGQHRYTVLLGRYHAKLTSFCLGRLCSLVAIRSFKSVEDATSSRMVPKMLLDFLGNLPMKWIKRLIECDWLCVTCEFDRYLIAKEILLNREQKDKPAPTVVEKPSEKTTAAVESAHNAEQFDSIDLDDDGTPSRDEDSFFEPPIVPHSSSLFSYNIFSSMLGSMSAKKRRIDETPEAADGESVSSETVVSKRLVKQPKSRKSVLVSKKSKQQSNSAPFDKDCMSSQSQAMLIKGIFESSIVYTYMTFPQLDIIKKDGIVPSGLVLESYWRQAELSNQVSGIQSDNFASAIPSALKAPFRFAARFDNLSEKFSGSNNAFGDAASNPATLYSNCVVCAGIQYRLLLTYDSTIMGRDTVINLDSDPKQTTSDEDSVDDTVEQQNGLRALLQRSCPSSSADKTPAISYKIYAFDLRQQSSQLKKSNPFFEPVTICNASGEGDVDLLPINVTKKQNSTRLPDEDSIWLVAVVEFV